MKIFKLVLVLLLLQKGLYGQTLPEKENVYLAGTPCPDFTFDDITYYKNKSLSLKDLKGKWFLLDFWSEYCGGCIKSLPKMDKLREEFKGKVEVIMVGTLGIIREKNKTISRKNMGDIIEKQRKEFGITLPVAYSDYIDKKLEVWKLPDIVVVDPDGIIRARTSSLTSQDLQNIISGKQVRLGSSSYESRLRSIQAGGYNRDRLLLAQDSSAAELKLLSGSVFTERSYRTPFVAEISENGRFELINRFLHSFYQLAYLGKMSWSWDGIPSWNTNNNKEFYYNYSQSIVLELKDSSMFDTKTDSRYCYSYFYPLTSDYPKEEASQIDKYRHILRQDLEKFFPYKAVVEKRTMPCLKLIATEDAKKRLKTKGINLLESELRGHGQGLVLKNHPVAFLLDNISRNGFGYPRDGFGYSKPFYDETGIEGNIDITLESESFNQIKKELKKMGLDIVEGQKLMNVLVIRDKDAVHQNK